MINRANSDVAGGEMYTEDGQNGKLFIAGDCDDAVRRIIRDSGWSTEFKAILPDIHANFLWASFIQLLF